MIHEIKDIELTNEQLEPGEILRDYRLAYLSRQVSLIGRRETLSGKAKFGIFGDGKEVAQIALAKAFRQGDFRSGYYRDQTLMLALGLVTVREFFAQLYADVDHDPHSGGRQMNAHFASRLLYEDGAWKRQGERPWMTANPGLVVHTPSVPWIDSATRLHVSSICRHMLMRNTLSGYSNSIAK